VAEVDEKVMSFVEETLRKNPEIQLADLFERAKKVSASVQNLSKRQFNARYPLQVKRRKSQARRGRRSTPRGSGASAPSRVRARSSGAGEDPRSAIRRVFLQFATDITGAEERKDLVRVLADVDRYVDQVLEGVPRA
jgi:hypothetical protein